MPSRILYRLVDAFFRRWQWYVLPLALLLVVGGVKASTAADEYTSTGVMQVSKATLLSELNGVNNAQVNWDTPANITSAEITALVQTDEFLRQVAKGAVPARAGRPPLETLRESISASTDGSNLVRVSVTVGSPTLADAVARSTISTFENWVVAEQLRDSKSAVDFFASAMVSNQQDVTRTREALDAYVAAHPDPAFGSVRPLAETNQIERLKSDVTLAETTLNATLSKSEEAKLAYSQAKSDISQRLRVVDAPQVPTASDTSLVSRVLMFAMFGALGLLLSVGAVVVAAALDRTVRTDSDVTDRLGLPLLASIPDVGVDSLELVAVGGDRTS